MQTVTRDIWELLDSHKIVIPVNLSGPMGRGLALQAKKRYPHLETAWKARCKKGLIKPGQLVVGKYLILFPVKYHWKDRADLRLLDQSLEALSKLDCPIALPRVGCGFGERDWDGEVRPMVEKYLGSKPNIVLVVMPKEVREASTPRLSGLGHGATGAERRNNEPAQRQHPQIHSPYAVFGGRSHAHTGRLRSALLTWKGGNRDQDHPIGEGVHFTGRCACRVDHGLWLLVARDRTDNYSLRKEYVMEKAEYEARWPDYCRRCQGWGAFTSNFDPSPAGVSLGAGKMLEVDPCPKCTDRGRYARCGGMIDLGQAASPAPPVGGTGEGPKTSSLLVARNRGESSVLFPHHKEVIRGEAYRPM